MAERLLEVKDLGVDFTTEDGVVRAVDNVSSPLDRGEFLPACVDLDKAKVTDPDNRPDIQQALEAARCVGASNRRLMANHILPNTLSAVIVAATVGVGQAIITESALSFLGLGFPPDMPTWGRLLYDAQNFLDLAPHWAIFPGLMIFLIVLSINYIGDGLRDALDPRKTQ